MNRRKFLKGMAGSVGAAVYAPHATATLLLPEEKAKEIITEVSEDEIKFLNNGPAAIPGSGLSTLDLSKGLIEITLGEQSNRRFGNPHEREVFKPTIGKVDLQVYSKPEMLSFIEANRMQNFNIDLGRYGRLMNFWLEVHEYHVAPGEAVILDLSGLFDVSGSHIDHAKLHAGGVQF